MEEHVPVLREGGAHEVTSMDETTKRHLEELRKDLEAIRTAATLGLNRLARLGAGFGPAPAPRVPGPATSTSLEARVRDVLPWDLLEKLTVVDQGDGLITIKAEWLGKEDWGRLDRKVKSMGGAWIRDGKNSRWELWEYGSAP